MYKKSRTRRCVLQTTFSQPFARAVFSLPPLEAHLHFFISKKHENKNRSVERCVSVGAPQPLLNTDFWLTTHQNAAVFKKVREN